MQLLFVARNNVCGVWMRGATTNTLGTAMLGALASVLVACAAKAPPLLEGGEGASRGVPNREAASHQPAEWRAAVDKLLITPPGGDDWQPFLLPGKRYAAFEVDRRPGRAALSVSADGSVSILRKRFDKTLPEVDHIAFSWKVDGLPDDAHLGEAGKDDAPVRILLSFDGDRNKWTGRNHRMSEMSRLLTGEELPYATLMYVWANKHAPETVIVNARTDRIRKVVVESGAQQVGHWRDYQRNIRADFIRAFGEEPGPLRAVAIMTDTDNTQSSLRAWYGSMTLTAR
ncbi:DUF3047 domain-containing protein [Hydrogenophaga pseudoflava]|uniref:DUF3047 domain-containing protein n=1 Tax=Hydrogenophaga pseudoflava TaxID=47421 RepID=UPI0027E407C1|nr:DUF3047 domain-containing protein [Hydrogenophaga pseudoflava]MDQ7743523.1 DUF3047 domain-containing protein [Hydrogenophaga pseudoflava]